MYIFYSLKIIIIFDFSNCRTKDQPKFPHLSKNHAYLFYHACLFDKVAAKSAMKRYIELRTNSPEIFAHRDPLDEGVQIIYDIAYVFFKRLFFFNEF